MSPRTRLNLHIWWWTIQVHFREALYSLRLRSRPRSNPKKPLP